MTFYTSLLIVNDTVVLLWHNSPYMAQPPSTSFQHWMMDWLVELGMISPAKKATRKLKFCLQTSSINASNCTRLKSN